jgi:hypothetical protein
MHLTFSFSFVDSLVELSFLKKFYSSKKQLYYVIEGKILWKWVQEYHLLWHGIFVKLLFILLDLLCVHVFWTSLEVIGC